MYPLTELLFLSISALLSGVNEWQLTVIFGNEKLDWLRKFFPFENGIPSADTLERLYSALDPVVFESCFRKWVNEISDLSDGEVIAIDGKTIGGSFDQASDISAKHVVTAYATQAHISLGQELTEQKSNEITAIPRLLELLSIKGAMISIDAMGCQKEIARVIREKEADYLLAVKQNQKNLHQQVEKLFDRNTVRQVHTDRSVNHGRVEIRICSVINELRFLDDKEYWRDLTSIIKLETEVFNKTTKKTTRSTRYYISSADKDAETFNRNIRSHWAIENNLHWMLDVSFSEDNSRRRKSNHAINFNLMAKTALGLLKNNEDKIPITHKRAKASLNDLYREKLLNV